ncbi:MAG: CopG-like 1 or ribbon-helix-helix domain, 5 [Agromyces sp.]|nr:CopG-like 1 or ribbon-helix-helix domain, 5 [Agromyces sp.]
MQLACYSHAMANLQVKDLPDALHEALRRRALEERVSISQLVTGMIERELRIAAMNEWLRGNRQASPRLDLDSAALIDEVRALDARH